MTVKHRPWIMVVGSINMDLVANVGRLPHEGETVHALHFDQHLGGKGANQAAAAAMLGARAVMVGSVGDDEAGARALERLGAVGVDCSRVHILPKMASGTALITVGSRGENTIVVIAGANGALSAADVTAVEAEMPSYDAVVVQFEVPNEVVLAAAQAVHRVRKAALAPAAGARRPWFVLNPSPFRPSAMPPAGSVDIIIVNEVEAEQITGVTVKDVTSAAKAARELLAMVRTDGHVVVTLGAQGAVSLSNDDSRTLLHIPAMKVDAVDTTGAGDVFAGGLVTVLGAGRTMAEALRFATAAAAITVTRRGAQASFPRWDEVDAVVPRVQPARALPA